MRQSPVRNCALILNDYLKVAKEEALLHISEGKASAVLGGGCHDYAIFEMEQVFLHSEDYLTKNFKGYRYFPTGLGSSGAGRRKRSRWQRCANLVTLGYFSLGKNCSSVSRQSFEVYPHKIELSA